MPRVTLGGCTATPFGGYLKALGVLRLLSEQADAEAHGWWADGTFAVSSDLDEGALAAFFVEQYSPTPILAPWNGGSGFYPSDNKEGIDSIASSTDSRFAEYRDSIAICREFAEVKAGKSKDKDEDERRTAILRQCRNLLCERAVDWLDAAVGIASNGSRSFAPVLGTGGNEGRLDYTNNFMARIAALLISPDRAIPVKELLGNSLFGTRTGGLQAGAAGQYDPGRAGGANQGNGASSDSTINPWDLVLTLEGAVAWASGLYRRQGVSYRTVLCSPFTVRASRVGYGSASLNDDARAEVWTPLWRGQARYAELKTLLREGRASVDGRPAINALEFAEAACSLGVDRGIDRFVRYSLLKRRGDSYVALPAGTFEARYRSDADRVRQFQIFFERLNYADLPRGAEDLRRGVDAAIYNLLLRGGKGRVRELMAALGRMLRRIATTSDDWRPVRALKATEWIEACGTEIIEVRIAAALASMFTRGVGPLSDHLVRNDRRFAWTGLDLADRMITVLERRLQAATAVESDGNPLGGSYPLRSADTTPFIEGSVDDSLIEELLFAFIVLDWQDFRNPAVFEDNAPLPVFQVLKHLFLPGEIRRGPEPKRLRSDPRVLSLLKAGRIPEATEIAVDRLRIAGIRPLDVDYRGGVGGHRLAASLLIPVRQDKALGAGIFHEEEDNI